MVGEEDDRLRLLSYETRHEALRSEKLDRAAQTYIRQAQGSSYCNDCAFRKRKRYGVASTAERPCL
jgi:hypothetical protein